MKTKNFYYIAAGCIVLGASYFWWKKSKKRNEECIIDEKEDMIDSNNEVVDNDDIIKKLATDLNQAEIKYRNAVDLERSLEAAEEEYDFRKDKDRGKYKRNGFIHVRKCDYTVDLLLQIPLPIGYKNLETEPTFPDDYLEKFHDMVKNITREFCNNKRPRTELEGFSLVEYRYKEEDKKERHFLLLKIPFENYKNNRYGRTREEKLINYLSKNQALIDKGEKVSYAEDSPLFVNEEMVDVLIKEFWLCWKISFLLPNPNFRNTRGINENQIKSIIKYLIDNCIVLSENERDDYNSRYIDEEEKEKLGIKYNKVFFYKRLDENDPVKNISCYGSGKDKEGNEIIKSFEIILDKEVEENKG